MNSSTLFAEPLAAPKFDDCYFYHVMDIPGHGLTTGQWDLRSGINEYLGHVELNNKRVLEIGPASGFLTFEMEKRGASVVSVETTDDPGWDFVPFSNAVMEPVLQSRRIHMNNLKSSYWFAHHAHQSKARIHYGDVYNLPETIGHFDLSVIASVLLHCNNPLKIVEQCAKRSDSIVIVDFFNPDLEGRPICKLHPNVENNSWDTWWFFSTDFFVQFLKILGFTDIKITTHVQFYMEKSSHPLFTIVAKKPTANPV